MHPLTHTLKLPAVRTALVLATGIAVGDALAPTPTTVLIPAVGAVVLALVLRIAWPRILVRKPLAEPLVRTVLALALYLLVALTGMYSAAHAIDTIDTALLVHADRRERVHVRGVVATHPVVKGDRVAFVLDVDTLGQDGVLHDVDARTQCYYSLSSFDAADTLVPVRMGDVVIAEGSLRSARPARNPDGFDFRSWLRRQGLTTTFGVSEGARLRVIDRMPSATADLVEDARAWVRARIRDLYPPERHELMDALILGEQGRVDEELMTAFRDAGVIHVIAVSGGHLAILLVLVWVPLGRLPYAWRAGVALALIGIYGVLTGLAPPVSRAVVMAGVFLIGAGLQRTTDPFNTLSVAAIVILLFSPTSLFSAGFQLSFAAVLALVWLHPRMTTFFAARLPRLWSRAWFREPVTVLSMTAAAQAGTFPIIAALFGTFSLVSFVANLVAVPLVFVAMATGFPALLANALGSFPARELAAVSDLCMLGIVESSRLFAALPGAVLTMPALPGWITAPYVALVVYLFAAPGRLRWKTATAAIAVLALVVWTPILRADDGTNNLRVTFLDVGQGDATLVEFPSGAVMLIDAGQRTDTFDAGERTIVPFLRARGITRIDALVLTHPDNDHIGGATAVLHRLDVARVVRAWRWAPEPDALRTDSAARAEGLQMEDVRAGARIDLDPSVRVRVLGPSPLDAGAEASNTSSIVLRFEYGTTSMLLTGDADDAAERFLIDRWGELLKADVLKVGHHGSASSTSDEFLAHTQPATAVISCGRLNRFGHPAPKLLDRLRTARVEVLRTDVGGAVVLESDGRQVRNVPWQ